MKADWEARVKKREWRSLHVCSDCYMAAANGADSVEQNAAELLADWRRAWDAACERHAQPLEASCVDDEHPRDEWEQPSCALNDRFSRQPCGWCGSTLAGNRHCAALMVEES